VWVKKIPPEDLWQFFQNRWEFFNQILRAYYAFLCTRDYEFLFNYLQLWRSYATLSVTTQFRSCARFGRWWTLTLWWSRLIWNNFVKVAGNWIKIRSLAFFIGTHNRHVKFGWKIPIRFGKIATSSLGGFFLTHTVYKAGMAHAGLNTLNWRLA